MFEFGRELRRVFGGDMGASDQASLDRAGLIELMDVSLLRREATAAETAARQTGGAGERSWRWTEAAALHREIARRTGEAESLRRSASAAELAWKAAGDDRRRLSEARREQGLTALLGADLFGDAALLRSAREYLSDALAKSLDAGGVLRARAEAAMAGLLSRRALGEGDFDLALDAASALDAAVTALDGFVAARRACRTEAAAVRCDRAELLLGFGARLREPRLVERARSDMAALAGELDPAYEPLSWSRARELDGAGHLAEGESAGRAEPLTEGVRLLADAAAQAPESHSPLDWARLQAALGAGLMSLGEVADSDRAFDGAQAALDRAQRIYDRRPALAARSVTANNRAACLARRAERSGDLVVLAQAEAALKAELTDGPARRDALAWAVAQLNLARIYEARDEIRGRADGRGAAVLALTEALEVFTDRGLKALAEAAQAGLRRLETVRPA
jgi:hypothetical protein